MAVELQIGESNVRLHPVPTRQLVMKFASYVYWFASKRHGLTGKSMTELATSPIWSNLNRQDKWYIVSGAMLKTLYWCISNNFIDVDIDEDADKIVHNMNVNDRWSLFIKVCQLSNANLW